jgi:hypothetical protein
VQTSTVSTQSAHEGTQVVSSKHRPSLSPQKYSWYAFLLEAESTPGPQCGRKDYVNKKPNNTIRNRTRDLSACSAVPQTTAPPRASSNAYTRRVFRVLNRHRSEVNNPHVTHKDMGDWCPKAKPTTGRRSPP